MKKIEEITAKLGSLLGKILIDGSNCRARPLPSFQVTVFLSLLINEYH